MEQVEIIFEENEPLIKVALDKVYSVKDFKAFRFKVMDEVHREQYERDKKLKWIDTTQRGKKHIL